MTIYLSILFAIIGLITYIVSTNGKIAEVGRLVFFCGLLVFLLTMERLVSVLPK